MDKKFVKEDLKTEFNNSMANSAFSDQFPANFDMTQAFDSDKGFNYSYFMDIFGSQEFTDLNDLLQPPPPPPPPPPLQPPFLMTADQFKGPVLSPATTIPESSEVVNTPATPNSSSISSSFNEVFRNEDPLKKFLVESEDPKKTNKQQKKPKKAKKKKEGLPRFAFKTKCEMDNLDDGYRWRKYGQKAVKNSPFPRNYYRCTTPGCDVKKKVERSFEDHAILITTYEGRHIHPCPATTPRGLSLCGGGGGGDGGGGGGGVTPYSFLLGNTASAGVSGLGSGGGGGGGGGYIQSVQYHQPPHYQQQQSFLGGETLNFNTVTNNSSLSDHDDLPTRLVQDKERRFCPSNNPIFMDGGLLEDIVTPQMFKNPKVEHKKMI